MPSRFLTVDRNRLNAIVAALLIAAILMPLAAQRLGNAHSDLNIRVAGRDLSLELRQKSAEKVESSMSSAETESSDEHEPPITVGGVGGGALIVPVLLMVQHLSPYATIPLSKVLVLAANFLVVVGNIPHVDVQAVALLEPPTLAGTVLGIYFNLLSPSWILLVCLVLILSYTAYKTFFKALSLARFESKLLTASGADHHNPSTTHQESPPSPTVMPVKIDNAVANPQEIADERTPLVINALTSNIGRSATFGALAGKVDMARSPSALWRRETETMPRSKSAGVLARPNAPVSLARSFTTPRVFWWAHPEDHSDDENDEYRPPNGATEDVEHIAVTDPPPAYPEPMSSTPSSSYTEFPHLSRRDSFESFPEMPDARSEPTYFESLAACLSLSNISYLGPLFVSWLTIIVCSLGRVFVTTCSGTYWGLTLFEIIVCIVAWSVVAGWLLARNARMTAEEREILEADPTAFQWNGKTTVLFPFLAFVSGVMAGAFGVGGALGLSAIITTYQAAIETYEVFTLTPGDAFDFDLDRVCSGGH
ncbi:hypothetical protein HDU93_001080 [Gonapodya sp. JEL0774]|nr:hypothetical protein HDU93_001080 [Gonapodya sp. JEL0774]